MRERGNGQRGEMEGEGREGGTVSDGTG